MKSLASFVFVLSFAAANADELADRGEYLVNLLSCDFCHTPGTMEGKADLKRRFSGSSVGIAYTAYAEPDRPGIVFPSNLTSDKKTGLADGAMKKSKPSSGQAWTNTDASKRPLCRGLVMRS